MQKIKFIWKVYRLSVKASLASLFKPLLHDTRLARLTYLALLSKYNIPGIGEIDGQRFTVQLLVYFSKMVTSKGEYNALNSF